MNSDTPTPPASPAPSASPPASLRQEQRLEGILARGLILGVALSASVTLVGAIMYLISHARDPVVRRSFDTQPATLRTLADIFQGVRAVDAHAIMQLGVVLLIATPIARVFFSLLVFAVQKDKLYVAISAGVLVLLLLGFLGVTH